LGKLTETVPQHILLRMNDFILHDHFSDPEAGRISSYFCQLFILQGQDAFQYAVLDNDKNSFISLADYRIAELPPSQEYLYRQLELLISADETLRKKFPSVVIAIDSPYHTLVPASLADTDQYDRFLGFNFSLPGDLVTGADRITEFDAVNIFACPVPLDNIVKKYIPGALIVHRSTAFLKAIYQQHLTNGLNDGVYLNIRNPFIDIAIFQANKLVFFNSFSCRSKEDILYFTLYTLEQINLRPESVNLVLSGLIDQGSEVYRFLEQYIRPGSFCHLPVSFNYSPLLQQIPSHHFTELYGIALCGS
jgi:hypothetical protein